jgi:phosphohistidine phosphatase SixA
VEASKTLIDMLLRHCKTSLDAHPTRFLDRTLHQRGLKDLD